MYYDNAIHYNNIHIFLSFSIGYKILNMSYVSIYHVERHIYIEYVYMLYIV